MASARQLAAGRRRLASTVRLALCLALATAFLFFVGLTGVATILAYISGVFFVVALFEFVSQRFKGKEGEGSGERKPQQAHTHPNDTFDLVESEGDSWRERRVAVENRVIAIRIPSTQFEPMLPFADQFAREAANIPSMVLDLFEREERNHPDLTSDDLVIKFVEFYNPKKPDVGEVYFGGDDEDVYCLYQAGRFFHLGIEN